MTPRQVRTFTTGAVASVALAVTGTAVFSSHGPDTRIEQSATSESPTTVNPEAGAAAGQRGQSVSSGLRDKALRTAVLTDIPPSALAAYQRAASSISAASPGCRLPWTVLAAVGQVESNHGRSTSRNARGIVGVALNGNGVKAVADTDGGVLDGDKKHDRAVGPMQILPSTWSTIAVDGDGDGKRNPQNIDDAALGAAVYLCGSGADLSTTAGQQKALRTYNNSTSYVSLVMSVARSYAKDEKAQYTVGSLQTGTVDIKSIGTSSYGSNDANNGTDAVKKTKNTKAKASTKKAAAKTPGAAAPGTKTPAKTQDPKKPADDKTKPKPPAATEADVPSVSGLPVEDAKQALHDFTVSDVLTHVFSNDYAADHVVSTTLDGKKTAKIAADVSLTVSKGSLAALIPPNTMSSADAISKLAPDFTTVMVVDSKGVEVVEPGDRLVTSVLAEDPTTAATLIKLVIADPTPDEAAAGGDESADSSTTNQGETTTPK